MINKKGNITLLIIACVLTAIAIGFAAFAIYSGASSTENKTNQAGSNKENNSNNANNTSTKTQTNTKNDIKTEAKESIDKKSIDDEEKLVEEVKKIDDAQGNIYEKEVSNGIYNVKVPVINLTTKAATRINSEVETKYKEASSKGYYIVYSYYMYTGMVTLILDNTYNSGVHTYEVYNINLETGKQMKNEDLLEKLKVNKDEFIKKAKDAYKLKFEEVFKDLNKDSNEYKAALNNTLNNAANVLNNPMYINLEGKFAVYANITSVAGASEVYYLVEF